MYRDRRLLKKLEAIGWPAPLKDPLGEQDAKANEFKDAFADLLELEKTSVLPLPCGSIAS